MTRIAPRPLAALFLLALLSTQAGCSLVASTDCTDRPAICPPGATCVDGACVAADGDADSDVDADADADSDVEADADDAEVCEPRCLESCGRDLFDCVPFQNDSSGGFTCQRYGDRLIDLRCEATSQCTVGTFCDDGNCRRFCTLPGSTIPECFESVEDCPPLHTCSRSTTYRDLLGARGIGVCLPGT
jgi:hypothetical protein